MTTGNKLRKWGFTAAAALSALAPYLPVIKPVVQSLTDNLGTHKSVGQMIVAAALAGLVAYQAFKADPASPVSPTSPTAAPAPSSSGDAG